MGFSSGHHAGYWEQNPSRAAQRSATVAIDPATNGGERGEVSIKGIAGDGDLDGGGQPGGSMRCDLEIRDSIGRDDHGLFTYAIFSHPATYPAMQIGESRFGVKLNGQIFDWLSIDSKRNKLMPAGADWDHGAPLNMKEARRLTTGVYAGQVGAQVRLLRTPVRHPRVRMVQHKAAHRFLFHQPIDGVSQRRRRSSSSRGTSITAMAAIPHC
jgi:rhamnogalacturonan endolyase